MLAAYPIYTMCSIIRAMHGILKTDRCEIFIVAEAA